jgi:hypothetical protein
VHEGWHVYRYTARVADRRLRSVARLSCAMWRDSPEQCGATLLRSLATEQAQERWPMQRKARRSEAHSQRTPERYDIRGRKYDDSASCSPLGLRGQRVREKKSGRSVEELGHQSRTRG